MFVQFPLQIINTFQRQKWFFLRLQSLTAELLNSP